MKQTSNTHPLVGTWAQKARLDDPDTSYVTFTISLRDRKLVVDGVDTSDGEKLVISDVRWDGKVLEFTSVCPSTHWKAKHVFRVREPGLADHQVTYTESELWEKRRSSKN